eukprot:CAMPEP_0196137504 /NCGR_PEP_ID=MMETSP0910-20130528/5465_1 /TAXON_ID=49265 /ORGANISM="Thalassiosira rotula, Strain GSO102" /LENGTH=301 /DNA_ID=CAMNT_0041397973 /DNA_START=44 /DNA_END=945 /DNA_ORIENTATION=+
MQQGNNNTNPNGAGVGVHHNDLEFNTTIDGSVRQNVPLPPQPPPQPQPLPSPNQTNSVLSNMISNSANNSNAPPYSSSYSSPSTTAPSTSSYTPSSYAPSALPSFLQFDKSSHPTACLFHILFKVSAFLLYALGPKIFDEDVLVTVLCILLLAADFWVVKNITGRLLVGLRWWNKVDPASGTTSWIYESADTTNKADGINTTTSNTNAFDSKFFWSVLYATPLLWGFFSISAILFLKVNAFVTLGCALVLSGSNVYGYYKCSVEQREKWNSWMNRGAEMGVGAMMRNSSTSVFGWLGNRMA